MGHHPQAPHLSPPRGSKRWEPLWEKLLWPAALTPAVPKNGHRASPLSLGLAKPGIPPAHHGEEPKRLWAQEQLTFSNMADF